MPDWPLGIDRLHHETVTSTNQLAHDLADTRDTALWITADIQTMGRGRRSRDWHSPTGNFYGSIIMPLDVPLAQAALYSFVTALAVKDAARTCGVRHDLKLKWPNDVLLNQKKISGILLETAGRRSDKLIIGVGVNLLNAPKIEDSLFPAASISDLEGISISPEDFGAALAQSFKTYQSKFLSEGFAPIKALWLQHAFGIGTEITARLPNQELVGVFKSLDDDGAISLETANGIQAVHAADIFFEVT